MAVPDFNQNQNVGAPTIEPMPPEPPAQSPFMQGDSSDISAPTPLGSTVPPFLTNPTPQTPQPLPSPIPNPPPPGDSLASVPPVDTSFSGSQSTIATGSRQGGSMKKIVIIVLALLLVILVVFAIVKFLLPRLQNGGASEATGTVTWWGLWEDESIVAPVIADFEANHPEIKVTYVPQSKQDYRERLASAIARGDAPDIFRIHNSWIPMFRNELSPIPTEVMTAQAFAQTYFPVAVSDLTSGTGIVGIPLMYDGLGLYINEEIFATYGKTIPTTWTELRDTAIDLTIKDENGVIKQAGVALGRVENVDHWPEILGLMMIQNGADLTKPIGELTEGAFRFFNSFSKTYGVWDETLAPSTSSFASGKLAMYIAPSWRVFEIKDQNPNLKFKVVAVPQLPKEDPNEPDITYATYWVESVWERSQNKDAAWEFLQFLTTQETLQKFYQSASQVRGFGEPYPRQDMRELLLTDPTMSGFISLAPNAKGWYLASRTFDGKTGINTQINTYYEQALGATYDKDSGMEEELTTLSAGVQQVLAEYGIIAPLPVPQQ